MYVHRAERWAGDRLVTIGDNMPLPAPPVGVESFLGLVRWAPRG